MDKLYVLVYRDILVVHQHVDQSALLVLNVPLMRHVAIKNVAIHVLVHVALVLDVKLYITIQFVVAHQDILGIHLYDARQYVSYFFHSMSNFPTQLLSLTNTSFHHHS